MTLSRSRRWLFVSLGCLAGVMLVLVVAFRLAEPVIVFHPTHHAATTDLASWKIDGSYVGYCRESAAPRTVWLVFQGNGGQAGPRAYFHRVSPTESIYVMEYPGYGPRPGELSASAINAAASLAWK